MAVSLFASGTQSASSGGTEYTLATTNASGTFRIWLDLANMTSGDVVEQRVKGPILVGGTKRGIDIITFQGAQSSDRLISISDAFETDLTSSSDGLEFTLRQSFGTGRSFPWKVTKIG